MGGEGSQDRRAPGRSRIAVVIPKYGLIGGAEKFAFELTRRLSRDDRYEFHVFANRWSASPDPIRFHKVPIVRFPRFLRPWSFAWLAERMVSRGGFDLVHSHDRIFAADVFTMHSVPHLGWIRTIRRKPPSIFDRAVGQIEKRLMTGTRCARFLPVSGIAGDAYVREYDVDPDRLRVVHPGVDIEAFSGLDRDACRVDIRARHGIRPDEIVLLFVGMNFDVKGLAVIMKAVARAKAGPPARGIRLLVVGKGDCRGFRRLALSLGIGDAVVFTGPVSRGVERYYLASDIFAMLSRFDTFGMAVLEAMAARLPVIISANVGARDVVAEGVNGFVVADAGDDGTVAGIIGTLLDDGARRRIGAEAFRTAAAHTWDRTAASVAEIYEELLYTRAECAGREAR